MLASRPSGGQSANATLRNNCFFSICPCSNIRIAGDQKAIFRDLEAKFSSSVQTEFLIQKVDSKNSNSSLLLEFSIATPLGPTAKAAEPKPSVVVHLILERVASSLATKFWSLKSRTGVNS